MNRTERLQCLETFKMVHLQPVEPILLPNLTTFPPSNLGAHSYYPKGPIIRKGKSSNFRNEGEGEFPVLGSLKMDRLHPVELNLFLNFFIFFSFPTPLPGNPICLFPRRRHLYIVFDMLQPAHALYVPIKPIAAM